MQSIKLKFKGPGKVCKTLPDGLSFDFLNFSGNSQIIVTVSCGNAEPLTMIENIISALTSLHCYYLVLKLETSPILNLL